MSLRLVVLVLIVAVAAFVIYNIFREAFDLLHVAVSVLGLLFILSIAAVAYDVVDLSRKGSSVLVVLADGGEVHASFVVNGSVSSFDDVSGLSLLLGSGDFKSALGSHSLLVVAPSGVNVSDFSSPLALLSLASRESVLVYPESWSFRLVRFYGVAARFVAGVKSRVLRSSDAA